MLGHVHLQGKRFLFCFLSFNGVGKVNSQTIYDNLSGSVFCLEQFHSRSELSIACVNSLVLHDVLNFFRCQPQYLKNALLNLDIVVGPALVRKTNGSYLQIKRSLNIQVSGTIESMYLILRLCLCETFILVVVASTFKLKKSPIETNLFLNWINNFHYLN